jgi:hypothetical protein
MNQFLHSLLLDTSTIVARNLLSRPEGPRRLSKTRSSVSPSRALNVSSKRTISSLANIALASALCNVSLANLLCNTMCAYTSAYSPHVVFAPLTDYGLDFLPASHPSPEKNLGRASDNTRQQPHGTTVGHTGLQNL